MADRSQPPFFHSVVADGSVMRMTRSRFDAANRLTWQQDVFAAAMTDQPASLGDEGSDSAQATDVDEDVTPDILIDPEAEEPPGRDDR